MSKLKNANRRKAAKHAHKIEGARVKAKTSVSSKVDSKSKVEGVKKCLGFIYDTFKFPAIKWCFQNWSSICDTAGKWAEIILTTVS